MPNASLVTVRRLPAGHLEARARPGSGRHGGILASFLQSDVQGDAESARALLGEIAAAQRGNKPQPGGVGNAFSITVSHDGVTICNAVVEDVVPERYCLGELRDALEQCIAGIEHARRGGG